jgi:hypothetical protein
MQLYTVHFTTKQVVSQFDANGRKTGEYEMDYPQTIHALPRSTAETYKKFGNWRIEPYYADVSKRPMESKKQSVGRATVPSGKNTLAPAKNAPSGKSGTKNAAATGDLAAALNAGR